MPYVVVAAQHAEQLSRSIMRLLRPSHLRDDGWTDLYCAVHRHPVTAECAIELPDTETVHVHPEAAGNELANLLAVFVRDQAITQQEAVGIAASVQDNVGQVVRIADFVPPSWNQNVKTQSQMNATGWFAQVPFP